MQMNDDRERFWKLLQPEYSGALGFSRKLAGDPDRGDDLFQDALVTAFTAFESLRRADSFKPWLYRIIVNTFRSQVRRPWWKRLVPMTPETELSLVADDPLEAHTARRWLQKAFQAISVEDQALVTLHELEGWPVEELARTFSRTEGAVKAKLFRARRKMKKALLQMSSAADTARSEETRSKKDKAWIAAKPGTD